LGAYRPGQRESATIRQRRGRASVLIRAGHVVATGRATPIETEELLMAGRSTRTTGDDRVERRDPGGTRPAPRPDGKKAEMKKRVDQDVWSGDRNSAPTRPADQPHPVKKK
jgi:hypothetical protein